MLQRTSVGAQLAFDSGPGGRRASKHRGLTKVPTTCMRLGYQQRVAGYTAALGPWSGVLPGVWRASGLHWVKVSLPKRPREKQALPGTRSRVAWCLLACVLRPSARISARCDRLAQAGACFHMLMTPSPAAGGQVLGPHMHCTWSIGQFGVPFRAWLRTFVRPLCGARAHPPCPNQRAFFGPQALVLGSSCMAGQRFDWK